MRRKRIHGHKRIQRSPVRAKALQTASGEAVMEVGGSVVEGEDVEQDAVKKAKSVVSISLFPFGNKKKEKEAASTNEKSRPRFALASPFSIGS